MPDTVRGDFPDLICDDCGEKGCTFQHWGSSVPKGRVALLCGFCWEQRKKRCEDDKVVLPLGVQPPGIPEELSSNALEVKTESGAIYFLSPTDGKEEWIVSREEDKLPFTRVRVMRLEIGECLVLKPHDGNDLDLWISTPVEKIKII